MFGRAQGYLHRNDRTAAYPDSYYAATAHQSDVTRPAWTGDGHVDVCIIGGGYTGLSAALHLAERGYDVALLEAHRIGWGASGRNGGQLGSGQRRDQDDLEALVGLERAHALWSLAEDAKTLAKNLIRQHAIDCDLKHGHIHADHRARYVPATHAYTRLLNDRYDYGLARCVDRDEMRTMLGTTNYYGGMLDEGAAHVHPLNFALGLARAAESAGARLYERSEVTAIRTGADPSVDVADGHISATYLVLACNGYLESLEPKIAARVMPLNNFIIATEPLPADLARELIRDDVAVSDSRFVVNYFRMSADRRLLFGGGESYGANFPADIKTFVRPRMLEIYPQLADTKIDYGWGGTLAITPRRLPCFMRIGHACFSAGGYSGHGVALATLAGQLMAEAVDGTAGRFDVMANLPHPRFPGGTLFRWPLLVLAMMYYSLRDRL
ncbi:MAG: FAD-binding oxidoreductase [Pseudomonadota bacterium]